jgi:hypothetical protein
LAAISACGDVKNAGLANVGQLHVRAGAVIDIANDCSAFRTPASLKFWRDILRMRRTWS